jgi:hypothetical protein
MGGTNINNMLIYVPSWRTGPYISATDIQGPFWDVRLSVAPSITPPGTSLFHGSNYRAGADKGATVLQDRWHSQAGTEKLRSVTRGLGIAEVMYDTYAGQGFYSDGVATKDLGAIDGKTSVQLDALFATAPPNGHTATGTLSSAPVWLVRRNGRWNVSAAYTAINAVAQTFIEEGETKGHIHTAADIIGAAQWVAVPESATSVGTPGQLAADADGTFLYCCVAPDVWRRVPLTTDW